MGEQEIETRPEVSTQDQSMAEVAEVKEQEKRADPLCYGIPGKSVWYCATCQQLLSSAASPHEKPLRAEKKEQDPPRSSNRATRRANGRAQQQAIRKFLRAKQRAARGGAK